MLVDEPSTASNIGASSVLANAATRRPGWSRRRGAGRPRRCGRPALDGATASAVYLLGCGLLGVAGLEPGHAATGVEDLLLAGVERVAVASRRRRGSMPFVAVLRVVNVLPQVQVTCGLDVRRGGCPSSWVFLSRVVAGSSARMRGREPEPVNQCAICAPASESAAPWSRWNAGLGHSCDRSVGVGSARPAAAGAGRRGLVDLHQELDVGLGLLAACSSSSSSACWPSSAESTRRSFQTISSSSLLISSSSRRVPDASTSMAGKMPLVGELAAQPQLHVAGALELLEDHLVHLRAGLDERGGDDRQRAAVLDVAGGAEEPLRRVDAPRSRRHRTGCGRSPGRRGCRRGPAG